MTTVHYRRSRDKAEAPAQQLAPATIERGWDRVINISFASAFTHSQSCYSLANAAVGGETLRWDAGRRLPTWQYNILAIDYQEGS